MFCIYDDSYQLLPYVVVTAVSAACLALPYLLSTKLPWATFEDIDRWWVKTDITPTTQPAIAQASSEKFTTVKGVLSKISHSQSS